MLGLLTVLLGGCGAPAPPERPNPPPEPLLVFSAPSVAPDQLEQAIVIARELRAQPEAHREVLQAHQLDLAEWEHWLVDIASDPDAAKRYAQALEPGGEPSRDPGR
jgi:hypothetical protein